MYNYEMLSNIRYSEAFQYQSVDMRNEAEDYTTSDFITKMLYLGDHFNTFNDKSNDNKSGNNTLRTSL